MRVTAEKKGKVRERLNNTAKVKETQKNRIKRCSKKLGKKKRDRKKGPEVCRRPFSTLKIRLARKMQKNVKNR